MLAGAVQLALVRGKLTSRWWTLSLCVHAARQRRRVPHPRAEPVVLLPRGVPPPRDRVDAARGRDLPARPGAPAAPLRLERRVRDDLDRARSDAVLRSRRRPDLRPSLRVRRRPAVRRRAARRRRGARSSRRRRSATRRLTSTSPATQSTLDSAPSAVVLRFDQSVTITPRAIEVFSADGRKLSSAAVRSDSGRVVRARVRGLRRGEAYTVRWRATSSDGHTGSGVYTFGVGVKPPPPTEAFGSTGPTWTDDVARWAYFVALALLIGTIGPPPARAPRAVAAAAVQPALRPRRGRRDRRRSTSESPPS